MPVECEWWDGDERVRACLREAGVPPAAMSPPRHRGACCPPSLPTSTQHLHPTPVLSHVQDAGGDRLLNEDAHAVLVRVI